jgi:archaemetzincin
MNSSTVTLMPFWNFGNEFLVSISEAVQNEFNCSVLIKEVHVDLSEFYDAARRQYNGDKLLRLVDSLKIADSLKTIGLFNVDLFIPILTYIFGQAYLAGPTAIASISRLSNESYGMDPDDKFLLERFKKEVIHELGHTFGLIHCHTPTCVMRSSTYVEDIDQKDAHICPKCRTSLIVI